MLKPNKLLSATIFSMTILGLAQSAQAADTPQCEVNRPINIGGMNWESNLILADIESYILQKGYGCKTDILPTETLPAIAALERGNLDVKPEVWLNSVRDPWEKAVQSGKVKKTGDIFTGGEAWFIPKYTAEKYPDLKTAADLVKYKDKFKDPEDPSKGRIYGCPAGWGCEVVTNNLHKAFNLEDSFNMYSPGTGAAQKAALTSAYKRKQDFVFYYWFPTPLVSSLELVQLEMPPYDEEKNRCLTSLNCENPQPAAYPENPVFTGINVEFANQAPKLAEFFSKVKLPLPVLDAAMARMEETGDDPRDIALWFLKNHADTWTQWVPEDVAQRVQSSL